MRTLECFPVADMRPELVLGPPDRSWIDGWELRCPAAFEAVWNGGPAQADLVIEAVDGDAAPPAFAESHFGRGILTLQVGYLFRTPPGWSLWVSGPPNHIKDGVQPLEGLVGGGGEPEPFTMNWVLTRPGRVRFERGEPFCFLAPVEQGRSGGFAPVPGDLAREPDLARRHQAWTEARAALAARIAAGDLSLTLEPGRRP